MARNNPTFTKIKAGFWSGIGIAVASVVVVAFITIVRPKLPFNIPA